MSDNYYTASQAQAKLRLSKAIFHKRVKQGLIPKVVLPGMSQGVYPKRDVDALALSMQMAPEELISFSRSAPADQVEEMVIGSRCFGEHFITPLQQRIAIQQKNEFTFHCLKVRGSVVGYISMFHLPPKVLDELLVGRRLEHEITVLEVLPLQRLQPLAIYLDVIAVDPTVALHLQRMYAGFIILHFVTLVFNLLSNGYQIQKFYTVTRNEASENLVRKIGFQLLHGKSLAVGRKAYEYQLDQESIQHLQAFNREKTS